MCKVKCLSLLMAASFVFAASVYAAPVRIIYSPEVSNPIGYMSDFNTYGTRIAKSNDYVITPPGITNSLKFTTLQYETGPNWRLGDLTSGSWGVNGDTTAWLSETLEFQMYVSSADALNLVSAGYPASNLLSTVFVLKFGNNYGENYGVTNNYKGIVLVRSFFLMYDVVNGLQARPDRTDQWLTLSIQRDIAGNFTSLEVANASNVYVADTTSSWRFASAGTVDWAHMNCKSIESWGVSPDNYSANLGLMAFGNIVPEPASLGLLLAGLTALWRKRG